MQKEKGIIFFVIVFSQVYVNTDITMRLSFSLLTINSFKVFSELLLWFSVSEVRYLITSSFVFT